MRKHLAAALAAALLAAALPASAGEAVADPVAEMQLGKSVFEKNCRLCHSLERSLAKRDSAEGWKMTVRRMTSYGAPLSSADRPRVVRYLATQSAFARKCSACHDVGRVVPDGPGTRDWRALTTRMQQHLEELGKQGKAPAGIEFPPGELEDIAALLQAVIPQ